MKTALKFSLLIILSCIFYACPSYKEGEIQSYIKFINKSSINIRCQEIWIGKITPADTIFQCRVFPDHISSDSIYFFKSVNHGGWEIDFKVIPYLQFLIMEEDVYEHYAELSYYDCDTIRKYVPILHRYQLTLRDLQRANWTVVYPPEE